MKRKYYTNILVLLALLFSLLLSGQSAWASLSAQDLKNLTPTEINDLLIQANKTDLNQLIGSMDKTEANKLMGQLVPTNLKNVLEQLEPDNLNNLLSGLQKTELNELLSGIEHRDLKNILGGLSQDNLKNILGSFNPTELKNIIGNFTSDELKNLVGNFAPADLKNILGKLNPNDLKNMLGSFNPEQLKSLLSGFSESQLKNILGGLPVDEIKNLLNGFNPDQLKNILGGLSETQLKAVLNGLGKDALGNILGTFDTEQIKSLLQGMDIQQLQGLLAQVNPEQLTQLLGNMDIGNLQNLLGDLNPETLQNLLGGLNTGQLTQLLGSMDMGSLQGLLGNMDIGNLQNLLGGMNVGDLQNLLGGFNSDQLKNILGGVDLGGLGAGGLGALLGGVSGGIFGSGEDRSYENANLSNSFFQGTYPQDDGTMKHKATGKYSVDTLSPWYMTNIQKDNKPYLGPIYRGENDLYRYRNRLTQLDDDSATTETKVVNSCKKLLENSDPFDIQAVRKELDACANQYILFRAMFPRIAVETQGANPFVASKGKDLCQPLRLTPLSGDELKEDKIDKFLNEYEPSQYIMAAWQKLLQNSSYKIRDGKADKEPDYSSVTIKKENQIPKREDFGKVVINDLTENQVERIYDPSHPFSPRWDFSYNERDFYSPMTIIYGGTGTDDVRCAGDEYTSKIKTDIMTWRFDAFNEAMLQRIVINIVCYYLHIYNWWCWDDTGCQDEGWCCATAWDKDDVDQWHEACGGDEKSIEKICASITKPVVPINTLKLRSKDDIGESPPGYSFSEYFEDHRPYMRCWDTGKECGETAITDTGGSESEFSSAAEKTRLNSDAGSKYTIVGAGREKERCMIGGSSGGSSQVDGDADPIFNWMELKLYQARGTRMFGLTCIPKHEAVFKTGESEEYVMRRSGGSYQRKVENKDANGKKIIQIITEDWPLPWQGYVSDASHKLTASKTGLDNAKIGDILVYDSSIVAGKRIPYTAYVTDTGLEQDPKFIKVIAWNHGKFPDACGVTDNWGMGQEFTLYKDKLPTANENALKDSAIGKHTDKCEDPALSACIEDLWSTVKIHTPSTVSE